jgi:ABC-type multidrug transport system permease subunit
MYVPGLKLQACVLTAIFQPVGYGFEAVLMNEFHTLNGTCSMLVPSGPGYENVSLANQVCSTVGAQPGQNFVDGNLFANLSYDYYYSHLWRVRVWIILHSRGGLISALRISVLSVPFL